MYPDEPEDRHSPLSRLLTRLFPRKPYTWEPTEPQFVQETLPVQIMHEETGFTVPCKGDTFAFQVTVEETWSLRGELAELEAAVKSHQPDLHDKLERRLREISRRYPPEDVPAFEDAADAEARMPVRFQNESGLACRLSARAGLDDALREKRRNATLEQVKNDAARAEDRRNAEHINRMRELWLTFLKEAEKDPLGSLSVQLAGNPSKVAELVAKHASSQEQAAEQIRKACETAIQAYRDKGLYEFEVHTDSAFRRLLQYLEDPPEATAA